ncbi:hypothetical protein THAOC_30778, partial [Thalassiosira oceanica]
METAAPPAEDTVAAKLNLIFNQITCYAAMGESPTVSAGAPAKQQDVAAGVESSPPEVAAPEGREESKQSVSSDDRDEEARDEPAADEASAPLEVSSLPTHGTPSPRRAARPAAGPGRPRGQKRSESWSRRSSRSRSATRAKIMSIQQKMSEKAEQFTAETKRSSSLSSQLSQENPCSKSTTEKKQDADKSGETFEKDEKKPEENAEEEKSKDEKKPEENAEEEKSKSDEEVSIKDDTKAKLGSFRGKLSSPKLLKKSTKKVDSTPEADDEDKRKSGRGRSIIKEMSIRASS